MNLIKTSIVGWLERNVYQYRQLKASNEKISQIYSSLNRLEGEVSDLRAKVDSILSFVQDNSVISDVVTLKRLAGQIEFYQPLYGTHSATYFPGRKPSRICADRADAILRALGGDVRGTSFLDVGSSLGYFSFFLADRGATVVGIESALENVQVTKLVQRLNGIPATFNHLEFNSEFVSQIVPNQFQCALLLSVLHHVIHFQGLETAKKMMAELMSKVPVLIVELALKSEGGDWYWKSTIPENEFEVFALCGEIQVDRLGHYPTHLSDVVRPLYRIQKK